MERYKKDHSVDGWPITDNGRAMDKDAVIKRLNNLQIAADTASEIMEALGQKAGIKTGDVAGLIKWIEALPPRTNDHTDSGLDQRMAAAGMTPVTQMLQQNALGKFSAHAGVADLKSFEEWIQMRRAEFIRMQARMTLDSKEEDDLFEWVVAHNAVLGEVMANFRQATGKAR